ncbi:MAG: hypothetical protein KGI78_03595 [Patescibacteria group bacterium]|nr:hypothetical protein [Patescibacteria group bacterium]MDE2057910.1 hypothetical protein [Patescibacteria group bacterium]
MRGIEEKLAALQKGRWWDKGWVQAIFFISAVVGIIGFLFIFFPPHTFSFDLAGWLLATVAFVLLVFIAYKRRPREPLVFIQDDVQSFWHLAPQPDGRRLTQVNLRGHVTNTSSKPLYLAKIDLISPKGRTRVEPSKFIFTVRDNVASSDQPIRPGERTGFAGHFFVEGEIGTKGQPLTIRVAITDNLGHVHKITFVDIKSV